jgi:cobalt-zinc-cadmium efflux system membrane fusion protein
MKTIFKIIIATIPIVTSCGNDSVSENVEVKQEVKELLFNEDQLKNAGITEGLPVMKTIGLSVFANGTVEVPPQNKTVISVPFGGFVKSLVVLDGMHVKKGQTLLTIEHPELIQLQQDYLELLGSIEYLEAEYQRQRLLSEKEASSVKSMQFAKSQYNAAVAKKSGMKVKLDLAGVNLDQLNKGNIQRSISVRSPFNGVVTKVNVNVGAYAAPMDHLLEIIDLQHSHAEVIAFEKDVKHLKIGQKVMLKFSDQESEVGAKIFLIGKEIGKDRTVKIHCDLDKDDPTIAPGAYFKAVIYTGAQDRYVVPSEAIVELNGKSVVFFPKKSTKGFTTFRAEEVNILATESGFSAFEYKNPTRKYTEKLVLTGAYDIMSSMLIQDEE